MQRPAKWILSVCAVAALAMAVFAGLVETPARSEPQGSRAGPAPAQRTDLHGFPRTFLVNVCSNTADLARRDMIIGYAYCDIKTLRRLNPKGIFLLQPGLFPTGVTNKGAADYGGMSVTYGTGLWHWRQGYGWRDGGCDKAPGPANLGCIREFSFDWDELRNADGSEAFKENDGKSGPRGWNLADPSGKGTRDLVARFMAYIAKLNGIYAKGWDGIFSDNWIYGLIGASYVYGPNLDTNRDGKVDDLAFLRKAWDNGLNEVGARLRSHLPGKVVVGNGNWLGNNQYFGDDPQGWLKSANGTMVEFLEDYYNYSTDLVKLASRWLGFTSPQPRYLLFFQNALDAGGKRLVAPPGSKASDQRLMLDPAVMRSMRWGLTMALISGAYYYLALDASHDTRWWYDEYDGGKGIRRRGFLGLPVGRPVSLVRGVWRRDFEKGIALNNSTAQAVTVSLKKPFRHLLGTQDRRINNGRVVTKVTLPSHDGLILLNIAQRSKK